MDLIRFLDAWIPPEKEAVSCLSGSSRQMITLALLVIVTLLAAVFFVMLLKRKKQRNAIMKDAKKDEDE